MTPGLLSALLTSGLAAVALIGPWLLRRAAPALVRVPRVAAVVVVGGVVVWLGAVLAIGPVLAWVGSGPTLLAGGAADVCQRCLAAANPFVAGVTDTSIPALVFLALPAAVMAASSSGWARCWPSGRCSPGWGPARRSWRGAPPTCVNGAWPPPIRSWAA